MGLACIHVEFIGDVNFVRVRGRDRDAFTPEGEEGAVITCAMLVCIASSFVCIRSRRAWAGPPRVMG
jgi:hypothetical protein